MVLINNYHPRVIKWNSVLDNHRESLITYTSRMVSVNRLYRSLPKSYIYDLSITDYLGSWHRNDVPNMNDISIN